MQCDAGWSPGLGPLSPVSRLQHGGRGTLNLQAGWHGEGRLLYVSSISGLL